MHISDLVAKLNAGGGYSATAVVETLKEGVAFAQKITPIAEAFGGPMLGIAFNVVGAIATAAEHAKEISDQSKVVFSSDNVADIKRMISALADENDKLSEIVNAT